MISCLPYSEINMGAIELDYANHNDLEHRTINEQDSEDSRDYNERNFFEGK